MSFSAHNSHKANMFNFKPYVRKMKHKLLTPVAIAMMLAFSACSSDDDTAGLSPTDDTGFAATKVVTNSGLKSIPVVATRGTENVTVEYFSGGKTARMTAPLNVTGSAANSALVSGNVQLYSSTPTVVNVYGGTNVLAENVLLPGLQTAASTGEKVGDTDAYFFVRIDDEILNGGSYSGQSSAKFYPQTAYGGSSFTKKGRITTEGQTWYSDENASNYIYSLTGAGTASVINEIPEFTASDFYAAMRPSEFREFAANYDNYKIIWYLVHYPTSDNKWHVDGYLTYKDTEEIEPTDEDKDKHNTDVPTPVDPDEPDEPIKPVDPDTTINVPKSADGIYHEGGVLLYEYDNEVKDYNDLVVDYDIEARFPKDGNTPYIKVVMHLRALSAKTINSVSIDFDHLQDIVCPADDMNISFHGVNIQDLPQADVPDFSDCELTPTQSGNLELGVENLQWLLTNDNANGWYNLDGNGFYNVTVETLNDKPYATVSFMLYPKEGSTDEDIEQAVANILSVATKSFKVNGESGDYIIAPTGTPHVIEGKTLLEAFPDYPNDGWWDNYVEDNVITIK